MATCFFSDDVLWRNHLIDRVALVEESPILLLPECLDDHFIFDIFHGVITTCMCFFWEIPRIEELQDPNSSPRRGEVGRPTLRDYGGFLLSFVYPDRFREVHAAFSSVCREASKTITDKPPGRE